MEQTPSSWRTRVKQGGNRYFKELLQRIRDIRSSERKFYQQVTDIYATSTDYAMSELVKYVIEDTGCSIEEAMERVYNSPLAAALQDEDGELYVQSPAYLYELMNR